MSSETERALRKLAEIWRPNVHTKILAVTEEGIDYLQDGPTEYEYAKGFAYWNKVLNDLDHYDITKKYRRRTNG